MTNLEKCMIIKIGDIYKGWQVKDGPFKYINTKGRTYLRYKCLCLSCERIFTVFKDLILDPDKSFCCRSCAYTTHGLTKNASTKRLYTSWQNMIARCYNRDRKDYQSYGAKGIKVCDSWRIYPELFVSWSLHKGYIENLVLDRIDPKSNYSPENCRWITQEENNKRIQRTHRNVVRSDGKIYDSVKEAASDIHCSSTTITTSMYRGNKVLGQYTYAYV